MSFFFVKTSLPAPLAASTVRKMLHSCFSVKLHISEQLTLHLYSVYKGTRFHGK